MNAMRPPEENDQPTADDSPSYHPDAGWHWHDAALIVFERSDANRTEYAVGAVDLYANALTGDLGGSYLELGAVDNLDRAADLYTRLQSTIDEQMLLPFQLTDYFEQQALQRDQNLEWRTAGPTEYAAYDVIRSLGSEIPKDDTPAIDQVQQFQDAFADGSSRLLEPLNSDVNYSFDITNADPWTMELRANKWWFGQDGALRNDGVTLNSYSLELFEFERESEREIAAIDREGLERTHREEGLEASMRQAEALAVAHGDLDPNREGGRLFYEGPPDRFTTLREAELAGREHDASVPERDGWQELLDRAENDVPDPEPHYWTIRHQPVETPDGEPLGTALVMLEFPQLTPDFGKYLEEHGMNDSAYPTEARRLEVAHFADEDASKKFEAEFRSYLVPGVIDGPELAPEVAKLEGLSGEWEMMKNQDIALDKVGRHAIVRDAMDWYIHVVDSERDAQNMFEVQSTDIDF